PSIGASGAISGILGSYFLLYRKEKILTSFGYTLMHVPAFVVIGVWFAIQFLFGAVSLLGGMGSNIAFWAHIGGFVFGFLFTLIFAKRSKRVSQFLKNPLHL
ncbi:MAG: rhomboid family intramembrane serine protease, partial [Candidatus Bathyarchaeota archaeon]|nr:rhomboid family intramembrane serine protease [Candidatus Bathyarchaeota archaeon]